MAVPRSSRHVLTLMGALALGHVAGHTQAEAGSTHPTQDIAGADEVVSGVIKCTGGEIILANGQTLNVDALHHFSPDGKNLIDSRMNYHFPNGSVRTMLDIGFDNNKPQKTILIDENGVGSPLLGSPSEKLVSVLQSKINNEKDGKKMDCDNKPITVSLAEFTPPTRTQPAGKVAATEEGKAAQPSFDCRKARSWSEREVCRDETLASLDVTLASLYRNQKAQLGGTQKEALIVDQKRWLADRDKCNLSDSASKCLMDIYKKRISELSSVEVGSKNQPTATREPEQPSTAAAKVVPIMQMNATKIIGVVFAVIVLVAIFAYSRHMVEQRFVHPYPPGKRVYRHWMDVCTFQAHNHPDRACLITGFLALSVLFVGLSSAFSGVAEAQAYGAVAAIMGAALIALVVYAWKDTDGFKPEQWKRDARDWPTNHWAARSVGPIVLATVVFCCTWYIVLVGWMASAILFFVRRV